MFVGVRNIGSDPQVESWQGRYDLNPIIVVAVQAVFNVVRRWPDKILRGNVSDHTSCFTDMLATFARWPLARTRLSPVA